MGTGILPHSGRIHGPGAVLSHVSGTEFRLHRSLCMAPRTFWKGYLKLSLVTCPVAMLPATTEADKLRFHTLNAKTGNRVQARYVDSVTGKPVSKKNEARGYPKAEDQYVLIEDDELENLALESTRTIDIQTFVPATSIGWIWYDKPHYLTPTDKVGEEAFSVIREAMAASGTVGISPLVMYRRERAVMLQPKGKGIVLWTLRYGDEVREAPPQQHDKPDAAAMRLVSRLIKERTTEWDPKMVEDPVQARLLDIIAAKKKRRKAPAKKKIPKSEGNVVSIMDALKKSLAAEKK